MLFNVLCTVLSAVDISGTVVLWDSVGPDRLLGTAFSIHSFIHSLYNTQQNCAVENKDLHIGLITIIE